MLRSLLGGGAKEEVVNGGGPDIAVVVKDQHASQPASRRGAAKENGGAGGALRSAERRAAAAQQRNLDKKIQALNDEMAEVEELMNRSLSSANTKAVDPRVAEQLKSSLTEEISHTKNQRQIWSKEAKITLAASKQHDDPAPAPAMWIAHKCDGAGGGDTQRKGVRTIKASSRRADADEEADKYAAKSRGGNALAMLAVYFGGQDSVERDAGAGLIPSPVGVRRGAKGKKGAMLLDPGDKPQIVNPMEMKGAMLLDPGRILFLVLAFSFAFGLLIYVLFRLGLLHEQHGINAHSLTTKRAWDVKSVGMP